MMNVMGNKNLIILAGSLLIILMFVIFVMSQNYRNALISNGDLRQSGDYVVPQGSEEMNVMLSAQGDSNESGVATLQETGGRVTVSIFLTGYTAGAVQPAHIHSGVCPGVGEVVYPLNSVVNGRSTTELNVSLAQLMQQLPLAVNVHKSNAEIGIYTSCGSL